MNIDIFYMILQIIVFCDILNKPIFSGLQLFISCLCAMSQIFFFRRNKSMLINPLSSKFFPFFCGMHNHTFNPI